MVMVARNVKSILIGLLILVATTAGFGQNIETSEKPVTKSQIIDLVGAGVDNTRIALEIEKRGTDFLATNDFLGMLRSKGANEALITALQLSMPHALAKGDLLQMLAKGEESGLIEEEAKQRGISFEPTKDDFDTLRIAGAREPLLEALRIAPRCKPPTRLYTPSPDYTDEARRAGLRGNVVLRVVVDDRGNVTDVTETSKPLGKGLDESAINTVRTWRLNPATRNGIPVRVRTSIEVNFSMPSF